MVGQAATFESGEDLIDSPTEYQDSLLRPMTADDLDELLIVQRDGAVVALNNIFPQDEYPFPLDAVRRRWAEELDAPAIDCFVIQRAGAIAGFVAIKGNQFLHFGTAVQAWGSGLAGRAHDATIMLWRKRAYDHAWLRVFEANQRARRFYERRGWQPTGERSRSTFAPQPVLLTYRRELNNEG